MTMRVLLTNDDGIHAPGLFHLAEVLSNTAEVWMIAPDRDRSGSSHALTLDRPLIAHALADRKISVNGTPADCVRLALSSLLMEPPQLVISGINQGSNLGNDVFYSGTVGAAREGFLSGCSALAISLEGCDPVYYRKAAEVVQRLITQLFPLLLQSKQLLNINIPDDCLIKSFEVTRLGTRKIPEPIQPLKNPRNTPIYWIGQSADPQDAGPGTDFHALANHHVSVTSLSVDFTISENKQLENALNTLSLCEA
jgi:5'-nucleotidase